MGPRNPFLVGISNFINYIDNERHKLGVVSKEIKIINKKWI